MRAFTAGDFLPEPAGVERSDACAMDAAHLRLEREDAQRRRWLNVVVRIGGRCRACGSTVTDRVLAKHPGVCADCFKRGRAEPIRLVLEVLR